MSRIYTGKQVKFPVNPRFFWFNLKKYEQLFVTDQKPDWSVYLLKTARGKIYTGITTDVERRFREHQQGGRLAAKYLRGKGPLQLVFSSPVGTRAQASKIEYRIKQLSRQEKERIIRGELLIATLKPSE